MSSVLDRLIVREAETFSSPGTADVTPSDTKKISPLAKHYLAQAKPFTACKRDQIKHGLTEDHAERRCAVLLDKFDPKRLKHSRAKEELEEAAGRAAEYLQGLAETHGAGTVASIALEEDGKLSESDYPAELIELREDVRGAVILLEAVGSWALPSSSTMRATSPMRRQVRRQRRQANAKSAASDPEFEKKHPRGTGDEGGQFISKGGSSLLAKPVARKLGVKGDSFGKKEIRQYQRRNGLIVDGKIGTQTASSLLGIRTRAPGALTKKLRRRITSGGRIREGELVPVDGELREYWDPENLPSDALGRKARKLAGQGALYLGAGVGAAKKGESSWVVTDGSTEVKTHGNPLTATAQAFEIAGAKTDPESPGGTTKITSAAIAARVVELDAEEADLTDQIRRLELRVQSKSTGFPIQRDDYDERRLAENRSRLRAVKTERRKLLRGQVSESELLEPETRAALSEEIVHVAGYRRNGKWVQSYPQIRDLVADLMDDESPAVVGKLPGGVTIDRQGKKLRVDGGGKAAATHATAQAAQVDAKNRAEDRQRSAAKAGRQTWVDPTRLPDARDEEGSGSHPLSRGSARPERTAALGRIANVQDEYVAANDERLAAEKSGDADRIKQAKERWEKAKKALAASRGSDDAKHYDRKARGETQRRQAKTSASSSSGSENRPTLRGEIRKVGDAWEWAKPHSQPGMTGGIVTARRSARGDGFRVTTGPTEARRSTELTPAEFRKRYPQLAAHIDGEGGKAGPDPTGRDQLRGTPRPSTASSNPDAPSDAFLLKLKAKPGLGVPERHQLRIAKDTLRMNDTFSKIMGGPDKAEARQIIKRLTR